MHTCIGIRAGWEHIGRDAANPLSKQRSILSRSQNPNKAQIHSLDEKLPGKTRAFYGARPETWSIRMSRPKRLILVLAPVVAIRQKAQRTGGNPITVQ